MTVAIAATDFNTMYVGNLAALYSADAALARAVDALPFSATPTPEPTRDGRFTTQATSDDGKRLYVHSRHAPQQEATQLVEQQCKSRERDATGEGPNVALDELVSPVFFVSGMGLGYVVAELERRFHQPLIIVAEPDLGVLKAALAVTDLRAPLSERRLTIVAAADKGQLHNHLRTALTPLMLGLTCITLPHTARCQAAFHTQVRKLLLDFVAYGRVQMYSLVKHARLTCRNMAFNLPHYLAQPGVEAFAGAARGYPAILVAAGPSLGRHLEQLAALQERAVIIAVQTVLKLLLSKGIRPHFVTSLDYHEICAQFFRGIDDFSGITLVAEPKAHYAVFEAFRGRTAVLRAEFADTLLADAAPRRGTLRSGSTVAHLSFYLAEHLGCDPVILIGQDLSFSDGLYYAPGMQAERIWQPELGRFNTLEMKQWERIIRARGVLRRVTDVNGRSVYTDEQMYTYAEQFQSDFAETSTRVIHACEGGMRLEGTELLRFADAATQFCTRPLPPGLRSAVPDVDPGCWPRAVAALRGRLESVRTVRDIAEQTSKVLKELEENVEHPARFNRLVARIDDLRTQMGRHGSTYQIVTQVSQLAELRRVLADRQLRDDAPETPAQARRRLKRDREFATALIEGCTYLEQMLPEALARLEERLA